MADAVDAGGGTFDVYATCPQSKDSTPERYLREVVDVARWSEAAGCQGILVYTDNGLVNPWLVAQVIIQHTAHIRPLVAVQPLAMHPHTLASMITTLGYCHSRGVDLNLLAGGFRNDLLALGDSTPHDERYDRTAEYAEVVQRLLEGGPGVTFTGRHYTVENLRLQPPLDPALRPRLLISGSSEAGMAAAARIGATAIRYPRPVEDEALEAGNWPVPVGIRVGLLARDTADEAWAEAHARFPEDRRGQIRHQLAMKVSDSQWHQQLSRPEQLAVDDPYWLGPFENSHTFCPYLVGSYEVVGSALSRYVGLGIRTLILDVPASESELTHIGHVLREATSA